MKDPSYPDLLKLAASRLQPPLVFVLGSPRTVADLAFGLPELEPVCYQMDLYQAERLREEMDLVGVRGTVRTAADLWDLPAEFRSVVCVMAQGGERELKLDMIEQAYHVLQPHGLLVVLSPYAPDTVFAGPLKKHFGKVHTAAGAGGTVLWVRREGDRARRRHEVTFQARVGEGPPLRFVSRPGVFSYGRFDLGSRALVENMVIEPGQRVLDLGCGCGTNGVFAARRNGPEGEIVFVDSNVRATALAELNARANEVPRFRSIASCRLEALPPRSFDVILANPPYYAQHAIARLFIERSHALLAPGGRLYVVTRQTEAVGEIVVEVFGEADVIESRGYSIFEARVGA